MSAPHDAKIRDRDPDDPSFAQPQRPPNDTVERGDTSAVTPAMRPAEDDDGSGAVESA